MHRKNTHMPLVGDPGGGGGVHLGHHPATRDSSTGRRKEGGHQLATAWEEKKSHIHFPMDQHVFPPKRVERKREGNGTTRDEATPVPHPMSATYWHRINANGWAPSDLFSWKKNNSHITNTTGHFFLNHLVTMAISSHSVGWWSSFIMSEMDFSLPLLKIPPSLLGSNWLFLPGPGGPGPFSPFPANWFQEALDPGNCPLKELIKL
jgi:hypothetical protein